MCTRIFRKSKSKGQTWSIRVWGCINLHVTSLHVRMLHSTVPSSQRRHYTVTVSLGDGRVPCVDAGELLSGGQGREGGACEACMRFKVQFCSSLQYRLSNMYTANRDTQRKCETTGHDKKSSPHGLDGQYFKGAAATNRTESQKDPHGPLPMAAAALRWRRWGYGPLAVLVALLAVQLTHAADAPCATAPEAAERHRFYTRIFIEDTDLNGTSAPMPEDARVERCVRA